MVGVGPGFSSDLVTLSSSKLAPVEINLPILSDETNHLMICGWNDLHAMQPSAPQDGIKGG